MAALTGSARVAMTAGYSDLPAPSFGGDTPMESLDCLPSDIAFFGRPQSSPMPDYSDLSYAATHVQVRLDFVP